MFACLLAGLACILLLSLLLHVAGYSDAWLDDVFALLIIVLLLACVLREMSKLSERLGGGRRQK